MQDLIVRRATTDDVPALAALIDGFAKGHPAEHHSRSVERMREAFFGTEAVGKVLLAERKAAAVGFGAWRKTYDVFWSMYGGDGIGLYVRPSNRGLGVALCIVAAICAEIQGQGGHFLQTSYDPALAGLYERVGVGRPERACHISALAFEILAGAAGGSAREILCALPDKALNYARMQPRSQQSFQALADLSVRQDSPRSTLLRASRPR
jgi:N-acetylglutamate synthase-like GNAT family acetyltransferase